MYFTPGGDIPPPNKPPDDLKSLAARVKHLHGRRSDVELRSYGAANRGDRRTEKQLQAELAAILAELAELEPLMPVPPLPPPRVPVVPYVGSSTFGPPVDAASDTARRRLTLSEAYHDFGMLAQMARADGRTVDAEWWEQDRDNLAVELWRLKESGADQFLKGLRDAAEVNPNVLVAGLDDALERSAVVGELRDAIAELAGKVVRR